MKKLLSVMAIVVSMATVSPAMAQDTKSSNSLRIGGTIESRCNLQVTQQAPGFDMQNVSPRVVAAVAMSCNRGQEAAAVTYESLSQGLRNANGQRIDYLQQVNGGTTALASEGSFRVHRLGGGQQLFSIQPLAAGATPGDMYSDIVRITVSVD